MSTAYEEIGRVRQKRRTRVSRTTAYRYFPSQAALLATAHPEIVTTTLLPASAPTDVAERLQIVVARVTDLVADTEPQQRTMLRLSLEPGARQRELLLRKGRVIGWLEDALAPLAEDLGGDSVRRLAIAIRSAIGIESFVWLTDVAGLTTADAIETMRWSARSLLDVARRGSLPPVHSHNNGSTRARRPTAT
jgi:AcrR family transcriptional regulator